MEYSSNSLGGGATATAPEGSYPSKFVSWVDSMSYADLVRALWNRLPESERTELEVESDEVDCAYCGEDVKKTSTHTTCDGDIVCEECWDEETEGEDDWKECDGARGERQTGCFSPRRKCAEFGCATCKKEVEAFENEAAIDDAEDEECRRRAEEDAAMIRESLILPRRCEGGGLTPEEMKGWETERRERYEGWCECPLPCDFVSKTECELCKKRIPPATNE